MALQVNKRHYAFPTRPVVLVCVDGCEPDYLAQAVASGHMPWMKNVLQHGTAIIADCVVPTFTNPNNLSIVTGVPPSVHGICGNYFLDSASGSEVMMNDPQWLRCHSIPRSRIWISGGWSTAGDFGRLRAVEETAEREEYDGEFHAVLRK